MAGATAGVRKWAKDWCAAAETSGGVKGFWSEVEILRDLLELEFFFPENDGFVAAVRDEVTSQVQDWEDTLGSPDGADAVLDRLRGGHRQRAHHGVAPDEPQPFSHL